MADFNKAFAFTAGWEGPWDGGKRVIGPTKFYDDTASYGITPAFLKDFVGLPDKTINNAFMRSIDYTKAAEIWKASRWQWFKLEHLVSDEIAILLFDWAVRRPNPCARAMAAATGFPTINQKYVNYGGNPTNKQAGGPYPTFEIIDALNAACQVNGQYDQAATKAVYQDLVKHRVQNEDIKLEGVKRRLGCLLARAFDMNVNSFNDLPAATKKAILDAVTRLRAEPVKVVQKKNLTAADRGVEDENTEGDGFLTLLKWGIGLWVVGKLV